MVCSGYLSWGQLGLYRINYDNYFNLSFFGRHPNDAPHGSGSRAGTLEQKHFKSAVECRTLSNPLLTIRSMISAGILNISPFWTTVSSVNKYLNTWYLPIRWLKLHPFDYLTCQHQTPQDNKKLRQTLETSKPAIWRIIPKWLGSPPPPPFISHVYGHLKKGNWTTRSLGGLTNDDGPMNHHLVTSKPRLRPNPRHQAILSENDWGVQSPPKRIGHLGSMKPFSV